MRRHLIPAAFVSATLISMASLTQVAFAQPNTSAELDGEGFRVALWILGDELECAFEPLADICLANDIFELLEEVPAGQGDRYRVAQYQTLMRVRGDPGMLPVASYYTLNMDDSDLMRAIWASRAAIHGALEEARVRIDLITSNEAKIMALLGLGEAQLRFGDNDGAAETLREAIPLLARLPVGVIAHLADEIAWTGHRAGDPSIAVSAVAAAQAVLSSTDVPVVMASLATMAFAGGLCVGVSVEEGLAVIEQGLATLANAVKTPDQLGGASLNNFVRATAEAWAARGYARCGDTNAASVWAGRASAHAASLPAFERIHVLYNLIDAVD